MINSDPRPSNECDNAMILDHIHPDLDNMTYLDMLLCDECAESAADSTIRIDEPDADLNEFRRNLLCNLDPNLLTDLIAHCEYPPYERRTARESCTELLLTLSLCPIHHCDYAACFDDDESECALIRFIHPCCDT